MKLLRGLAALALALTLASTIAFAQVSPGTSPLSVVKGGTGAATAAGARGNLGVDRFTGHGDSNYTIAATDRVVGTNAAFTASRTWTLPAASAVNAGQGLIVADFEGTVTGSNTLVIARAGSDTINGGASVTINSANGAYLLVSDGSSRWTAQAVGSSIASGVSSIDGASGAISTQAGSLEVTGSTLASNVLSSRTFAATQDLSAFSAVQTLGYATAGDGGGATFKNIGSAPFLDANITAGTIVGGSGYVNGTYLFAEFTGGSGHGFVGKIVVSSGAVTSVTPVFNAGGYGYAVGDVLTASNAYLGGTGSGFTYTVTTLSTPKASFTDSAGNHWQYIVESFLDPRQFGAKWDWITTDTGATDDAASIQATLNFAAYTNTFQVNGNITGSIVQMPRGSAKICSGLTVYGGIILRGHGPKGTSLRVCDAWANGAENILTLCDTVPHVACFGPQIADFDITATTAAAANVGTYAIYTNAAQQARAIQNVSVYAGKRGCLRYDTGYGGAAGFYVYDFFCTMAPTAVSNGIVINAGTTLFKFFNTILEAGGAGYASNGFNLVGGQITIDGLHSEGITTMINVDMATSSHSATVMHVTGGNLCSEVVKLQGTNSPGNFAIYDGVRNGCTNLVTNGQSGGSSRSADARPSAGWVFFNP